MRRKRILVVASWYPSDADGLAGVFVEEQAAALAKRYDVAVVVPEMASWRDALKGGRSRREERNGLTVYRERALPPYPRAPDRVSFRAYARAVEGGYRKFAAERGEPDVIHAHVVLPGGWAAVEVGRRRGVPVVLTEHSSPFSMHLGTETGRRLARETLDGAARVLAVSPALREQIVAFHPRARVGVLGNLVRTELFTPAANGNGNGAAAGYGGNGGDARGGRPYSFLTVARLAEQKGLDHLVRAAALVAARGAAFELVVAGDGPERERLETLACSLGLSERCRFAGALDRLGVRDAMRRCDALVLPSLHETFGLVVAEAMACGKPVIATRCGGPEFVVDADSGVLVERASAESLAEAMAEFAAGRRKYDPARVRESVVGRFGEGAFLQNISAVYDQLGARN